jgi:NitT/TauT family transport system substrate-binding protein
VAHALLDHGSARDSITHDSIITHDDKEPGMMRRRLTAAVLTLGLFAVVSAASAQDTIRIGIGHQSLCTDTYSGGITVKSLGLLEKHLPRAGKYANVKYDLVWEDYTSGPPITNQMLAGKLDIGVMGDYPLLVNVARFQETNSLKSVIVSMTGYNMFGSGNSIVVPADAAVYRFEDLKGKKVSVPFGSAAHGMLLKALVDRGLTPDFFTLINQSPPVGATSIQEKKIDAHADFCPWGELMEFKGFGRKIFDGSQAEVAYLHGPVVRKDFAEKYPEIVVAYLKAVIEANEWITKNPEEATTRQEQWTSIPKEVLYLYFGRGGFLTLDATIKPKWVEVLKYDATVLQKMNIIKQVDLAAAIDDRFVKQAYKELGRDYARDQKVIVAGTSPLGGKDATGAPIRDPRAAGELWLKGEKIRAYASVAALLAAMREAEHKGAAINAGYVFDQPTGLKLFAHRAFYVAGGGGKAAAASLTAFAWKEEAARFAARHGGKVLALDDAKKLAGAR